MTPFFIVGCGRSGTTLLRTILNQHPKVAIPLESLFVLDYLRAASRVPVETLKELMVREYEIREWGLRLNVEDFSGCSSAKQLVDRVHEIYMRKHGKVLWGQKTPRFVRCGDLLKESYPEARFIHIIRDPRAVASSLIRSNVHRSNAYFAARRWVRDVGAGLALKARYPDDVLQITYEDLLSEPQVVLEQVCGFIGVEYDPSLLSFRNSVSDEYGPYYSQVHARLNSGPDRRRIDAWREHLTPAQVSVIESECGDFLGLLNYAPCSLRPPRPIYIHALKLDRLIGLLRQAFHYLLMRRGYVICSLRRKTKLSLLPRNLAELNY